MISPVAHPSDCITTSPSTIRQGVQVVTEALMVTTRGLEMLRVLNDILDTPLDSQPARRRTNCAQ